MGLGREKPAAEASEQLEPNATTGAVDSLGQSARASSDSPEWPLPTAQPRTSRVSRPLRVTIVSPGRGTLQEAIEAASHGDELVLEDGNYTGSGDHSVLNIDASTCSGAPCDNVVIRAQNHTRAVIDGEGARGGVYFHAGTVTFEGLLITRGYSDNVSARPLSL
jgi:hypothetical protein